MQQMSAGGVLERVDAPDLAYAMRIDWDPDDRIFVATVPELPGCMTHGATRAEAARKGDQAIAAWLAAARHWGTPIPPPRAEPPPVALTMPEGVQLAVVATDKAIADVARRISRLAPDTENLPEWVIAEFLAVVGVYQRLPDEERAIVDHAFREDGLPLWLVHLSARLVSAHQHITGETLPASVTIVSTGGDREGTF